MVNYLYNQFKNKTKQKPAKSTPMYICLKINKRTLEGYAQQGGFLKMHLKECLSYVNATALLKMNF